MGLVLPINTIAALLASLPSTTSWASIRCHWRLIPFFVGNSVLIDTRLQLFAVAKYLVYGVWGFVVKLGYTRPTDLRQGAHYPDQRAPRFTQQSSRFPRFRYELRSKHYGQLEE